MLVSSECIGKNQGSYNVDMASERTVTERSELEGEVGKKGDLVLRASAEIIFGIRESDYQLLDGNYFWLLLTSATYSRLRCLQDTLRDDHGSASSQDSTYARILEFRWSNDGNVGSQHKIEEGMPYKNPLSSRRLDNAAGICGLS